MEDKLCCLINAEVSCNECNTTWCYVCWDGWEVDHCTKTRITFCPKTGKDIKWLTSARLG